MSGNNYDETEGRYAKLGRMGGELFGQLISLMPSGIDRGRYRREFLDEFDNYSNMPRKEGAPVNEGCVWELHTPDCPEHMDIFSPRIVARWLKEHQHTCYVKKNSKRERDSFLEAFVAN